MIFGKAIEQRLTPRVLVENKICFAAPDTELGVYDTFAQAERVALSSDQLLFCGMVSGKKIMHAAGVDYHKEFLPHESFVIAPDQPVEIDFPEARENNPTTCLAIEISKDKINQICDRLNLNTPIDKTLGEWQYHSALVHTHHNTDTQTLLNRIVNLFVENDSDRNFLIDLAVSELIARLLRHQSRELLINFSKQQPEKSGFGAAIAHLTHEYNQPLDIEKLSKLAGMSRTKFYEQFKLHIGATPQAYQLKVRLDHAAKMIEKGVQITQSCFDSGFSNSSHFSRSFKNHYGLTPVEYRQRKLLT